MTSRTETAGTTQLTAVEVTAAVHAIEDLPAHGYAGWFGQSTLGYREDVAVAAITAALPFIAARLRKEATMGETNLSAEEIVKILGRDHREDWQTWDGSYQQAYLRGRMDAANPENVIEVDGDPMPFVTLADVWHTVMGYLQEARDDGGELKAEDVLSLMVDLRREAYKPVHDWWHRHYDYTDPPLTPPSPVEDVLR